MAYAIEVTLTNEDEGHAFAQFTEHLEEGWTIEEDGTVDFGQVYRLAQAEYGRCQSSIYVDSLGGPKRVGWFFVSRQRYEDTGKPYLRGAWVTVIERTYGLVSVA